MPFTILIIENKASHLYKMPDALNMISFKLKDLILYNSYKRSVYKINHQKRFINIIYANYISTSS